MARSELIRRIVRNHPGLSGRDVEIAVKVMLDQMAARLAGGGRIEVRGFGSFALRSGRSLGRDRQVSTVRGCVGLFVDSDLNLRRERQAEGVAAAKRRATYRRRPPSIDMEAIKHRLARGLSPTAIARELRISRGTVYKARADMTDIA